MKRSIVLLFLIISLSGMAQEAAVEKSVSGIQTGPIGIWVYNEFKLAKPLSLRLELGFNAGDDGTILFGYYHEVGFVLAPVITAEPRYYYNLKRRILRSKDISHNSGSFVSLNISYYPNWFVIPDHKQSGIARSIFAIPTWGIRRNLGNHFNYEAALGLGYGYIYEPETYYWRASGYIPSFDINTHLRIGYRF